MSTFLLKFEAIESRIASYSCPRGIPGRVHTIRLRRCFQNNSRRQSTALGARIPVHEGEIRIETGPGNPGGNEDIIEEAGEEGSSQDEQIRRPQPRNPPARRGFGASILRTRLEGQFGRGYVPQVQGDIFRPPLKDDGGIPPAEDEAALYAALRTGDPHAIFKALSDHAKLVGFHNTGKLLISTPPATFSEILRSIDPKHFVGRYEKLHKEISPAQAKILGLGEIVDRDGYYKFCSIFLDSIQKILEARHWQYPTTLSDYKYLLKCARATGHIEMAEYIWINLTAKGGKHGIFPNSTKLPTPDAECYNCYLSIKCWHGSMNPLLRYRLRVIPDNFGPRSWRVPPYSLKGYAVGRSRGIKGQVSKLFREMVEAGLSGNEETFCIMMVSLAREGDMAGVASILQRVWSIDVQRLTTSNEAEIPPAKSHHPESPFYPSSMLLYSIAHAYGVNNQLPTALRLVDYVSGQYSIPIPTNVWNELLQWTFVLSIEAKAMKRRGEVLDTGQGIGQLPKESVSNLWNTMVSEPYNVKPTMEMYNRLIINLTRRQRYGEMQSRMEEARQLLKEDVRRLSHLQAIFNATTRRRSPAHLAERRMRDLVLARLRVRRNRKYIQRWVKLIIHHGSNDLEFNGEWSARNLPKIIKNWSLFLPERLRYTIGSGIVSFLSGSKAERASRYMKRVERSEALERRQLRIQKNSSFWKRRYGVPSRQVSGIWKEFPKDEASSGEYGIDALDELR